MRVAALGTSVASRCAAAPDASAANLGLARLVCLLIGHCQQCSGWKLPSAGSTVSPTADPSADEGRALSLALMSAILAAIDDAPMGGDSASAGSPHNTAGSLVRPPELAKLDVLPQRQPPMQQQLQQQQEGQQPDYGPAATRNVSEPAAGSQARLGQHHARTGAGAMQQQAASTSRGHVPDSPASPKTPVASPQLQCAQSGSAARAAAGLASIVGSLTSPFAKAADTGNSNCDSFACSQISYRQAWLLASSIAMVNDC